MLDEEYRHRLTQSPRFLCRARLFADASVIGIGGELSKYFADNGLSARDY
ncbi:hypothetical protein P0D72_00265 [Paraburkholderia sediminicola]